MKSSVFMYVNFLLTGVVVVFPEKVVVSLSREMFLSQ